jgi:hypothetical protein
MLKGLLILPLRAQEGFINSVFSLMNVPLSSSSKRAQIVDIQYRNSCRGPIVHLVVDATGLKVYEWKMHKHGKTPYLA